MKWAASIRGTKVKLRSHVELTCAVLIVLVGLGVRTGAQTRGELGMTASGQQNLGYQGLSLGITGRVEKTQRRVEFFGEGTYFVRAHKYTGDGYAFGGNGGIRVYRDVEGRGIYGLFGGSVGYAHTQLFDKWAGGFFGGGGYRRGDSTIEFIYQPRDFSENSISAFGAKFEQLKRFGSVGFVAVRPFVESIRYVDFDTRAPHAGLRGGVTVSVGRFW